MTRPVRAANLRQHESGEPGPQKKMQHTAQSLPMSVVVLLLLVTASAIEFVRAVTAAEPGMIIGTADAMVTLSGLGGEPGIKLWGSVVKSCTILRLNAYLSCRQTLAWGVRCGRRRRDFHASVRPI
jgi:hypothetical protein